jgi:hypothetical protein
MDRIEIKLASDEIDQKTGEFSGYGAVFGNVDSYGDVIEKGAFKSTLLEWEGAGKYPPMLLQHGGGWMGGADDMLPIGQWTAMEENAKGLKVSGKLFALSTERGQYIYEGLKSGVLDGLSIGYRARKFVNGTKPGEPRRKLTEIDLMEVSIVTFPANGKARVGAVKAADIKTIREFEDFLRDAGGFSHAAAKAIASGGFKAADPRDEDGADLAAILRRNIANLSNR